jgi:hypothetical protein
MHLPVLHALALRLSFTTARGKHPAIFATAPGSFNPEDRPLGSAQTRKHQTETEEGQRLVAKHLLEHWRICRDEQTTQETS